MERTFWKIVAIHYNVERGGHGNPVQYSCLENPMDRGASWWAAVQKVEETQTRLKQLSTHARIMQRRCCTAPAILAALCVSARWRPEP